MKSLFLTFDAYSCKLTARHFSQEQICLEGEALMNKVFTIFSAIIFLTTTAYAGTITGKITYEGKVPNFKPIKMDADPVCSAKHTDAVYPEPLVLGEGNTMANVFVKIKSGLEDTEHTASTEPFEVNQAGCTYTPHVFAVMAGRPIKFLNPDGTLHNVHALPKVNDEFNLAMPKFRKEFIKTFDKPEDMFAIKCDVHPWMSSWCAVVSHPYFDVTEKEGAFTLEGLAPGTYEVEAWHEKLGTKSTTVTITGDENQTADFVFSRPSA